MLSPAGWWLAVAPVDLRCGIDRLLVKIGAELGRDPRDGSAYVFRNRAGTRIKVLCMDAQGVWLCVRRLHEGTFHWPRANDAVWSLSTDQFTWLCAGIHWERLSRNIKALPNVV